MKKTLKKNVTNEKIFVDFFKEREPFRGKIDGKDFFRKVRCGLLHETQTKGEWVIRKENSDPTIFIEGYGNGKVIYRNNFQAALVKAINNYKEKIVNGDQSEDSTDELRSNFIAKFDHICNQSVVKK